MDNELLDDNPIRWIIPYTLGQNPTVVDKNSIHQQKWNIISRNTARGARRQLYNSTALHFIRIFDQYRLSIIDDKWLHIHVSCIPMNRWNVLINQSQVNQNERIKLYDNIIINYNLRWYDCNIIYLLIFYIEALTFTNYYYYYIIYNY